MARFQKPKQIDNKLNDEILSVLEDDYDGNMLYYSKAEQDVIAKHKMINNLHNISDTFKPITSLIGNKNDYSTYIDFKNNEIGYINTNEPILGYSLDFFNYRRILPFNLTGFLNKQKNKDLKNDNTDDDNDKLRIINWVEHNFLRVNFSVNSISLNRNNGVFKMMSSIKEEYVCFQYITCKLNLDKVYQIANIKRTEKEWIKDYNSLFAYFMLFSSEMYCRCNCNEYQQKYSKREAMSNYMCYHIMWALTMLPHYLFYTI